MRLSKKEIQVILRVAKEIYGEGVEIYLFGSRINDEKKGGDIDLLVRGSIGAKRRIGSYQDVGSFEILFGRSEDRYNR